MSTLITYGQQPAMVQDLNPGSGSGSPSWLTVFNNTLLFNASNGTSGYELWSYDGTNTPAVIHDLNPGSGSSTPSINNIGRMGIMNGTLYYSANDGTTGVELFKYTGTGAPSLVADIEPGSAGSFPASFVTVNGKSYFSALKTGFGRELWSYDPATGNAQRLSDINTSANSNVFHLAVFNNKIYFTADDATAGTELFSYDPASGNIALIDINTGASSGTPQSLTVIGNKLYFSAVTDANGRELYAYDGTNAPVRLTDIMSGPAHSVAYNDDFRAIVEMNGNIIFSANTTAPTRDLYMYNPGTSAVTMIANPNGVTEQTNFCLYGGKLYFYGQTTASGTELWMYDGVNAPSMVADINPGAGNSHLYELTVFNNKMYFRAVDATAGPELFVLNDPALGISSVNRIAGVKLYPNPAVTSTTLQFILVKAETLTCRVVDGTGKEVYHTESKHYNTGVQELKIPAGGLTTGVYFYSLQDEQGAAVAGGRLIKE